MPEPSQSSKRSFSRPAWPWHTAIVAPGSDHQPWLCSTDGNCRTDANPARFRNDVEGRRQRAARSSDDTHSFHLIKLLFSIGELLRRQSAGLGEYGRTSVKMWCSKPCLGLAFENVGHASKARSRNPDVDAAMTMLILSGNDRRNTSRTRNSELRSPTRPRRCRPGAQDGYSC